MKITNEQVFGFESAIRGLRNPMNSWSDSDSHMARDGKYINVAIFAHNIEGLTLGQADQKLSQKLTKAGSEHCKHLRLIQIWFDLDAPRYLWAELDTYKHMEKVSCSTMHKLFERELTINDFEFKTTNEAQLLIGTIRDLNRLMREYKATKDAEHYPRQQEALKEILIEAKTILPESFLQKRTVTTNYQQLLNIYYQRRHHKLPQWREICDWIITLPYFKELTGIDIDG